MDIRLQGLIHWPDQEALQKIIPACFQVSFDKIMAIIIDCFKIFIERPQKKHDDNKRMWQNYLHKLSWRFK